MISLIPLGQELLYLTCTELPLGEPLLAYTDLTGPRPTGIEALAEIVQNTHCSLTRTAASLLAIAI